MEKANKLKFASNPIDRHRGSFVRRRAEFIGSKPSNAAMIQEPGQTILKKRIDNEYAQLDHYLATKAKALNPKAGGVDANPPHLDLRDLAQPKVTTSASEKKKRENDYRGKRDYRIRAIGWRAAAIHDDLWLESADAHTATLRKNALDEIIDRRLYERMNFQISRADALGGSWTFTGSGVLGPWKDGFRVRIFNYPRIPHNPQGCTALLSIRDVLFMALLSFRGISTPSLTAQGEQRRFSFSTLVGAIPQEYP